MITTVRAVDAELWNKTFYLTSDAAEATCPIVVFLFVSLDAAALAKKKQAAQHEAEAGQG